MFRDKRSGSMTRLNIAPNVLVFYISSTRLIIVSSTNMGKLYSMHCKPLWTQYSNKYNMNVLTTNKKLISAILSTLTFSHLPLPRVANAKCNILISDLQGSEYVILISSQGRLHILNILKLFMHVCILSGRCI